MKKTIITIAAVIVAVMTVSAQDAASIVKRYMKETNLESFNASKDMSFLMDMTMNVDNQGQKITIPVKMISKNVTKMNMTMQVAGQDMQIVINGERGWMKMGGMVQALPAEQMKQFTEQTNVIDNFKFDLSKFNAEFVSEKDGIQTIKLTAKDANAKIKEQIMKFDAKTGLLNSIDVTAEGMAVTTIMKNYKKFGNILIPAAMDVLIGGKVASNIVINTFDLNYPTQESMFVEPK